MKIWINNELNNEIEIDDSVLLNRIEKYIKMKKDFLKHFFIEQIILLFLSENNYSYEKRDFQKLLKLYDNRRIKNRT